MTLDTAAHHERHLLERPASRPPRFKEILKDFGPGYVSNGLVGFIFSASGPVAVTLAVGAAGGLSPEQMASWVFAIFLSAGLATLLMSWLYRRPLGYGWSIPGTVLLGPSFTHLSFPEVVGAFFTCGVLILALGFSGVIRKVMKAIPMPIVMAMVAAVFLRFGTDVVVSSQTNLSIAAPMIAVFLLLTAVPKLGKMMPPVLGTLITGVLVCLFTGQFNPLGTGAIFAEPVITAPEFTWAAQLELVIPLAITVLFVQNGQGIAVLRAAGHHPPVNMFAVSSGAFSIVNALFGAVSACVTGPTNAMLTQSGEKHRQYTAALTHGTLCLLFALFAPVLTRFMLSAPNEFILTLGGLAMIKALLQAFVVAFSSAYTMGALTTFVVTISGLSIWNIHPAFWGLVIGYAVSRILEREDYRTTAPGSL